MRFINITMLRQTIPALVLLASSASLAQSVTIPSANTTYPAGIHPVPPAASQCMGCHGAQGLSDFPDWPNLVGLTDTYIKDELQKFKDGRRDNAMMRVVAHGLSEQETNEVAAYFSGLPVAMSIPEGLSRPEALITCVACHGDGAGKIPDLGPNIVGQKVNYMLKQAHDFQSGQRKNVIMENILNNVSPDDLLEITQYYGQLQIQVVDKAGGQ